MQYRIPETADSAPSPEVTSQFPLDSDLADAQLSRSFREGDEVAFSLLYGRFRATVARQVRARIENAQAAEELVQEIFLKAFRFRELYDPAQRFSAWIRAIAANSVADWLRSHRRQAELAASAVGPYELPVEDVMDPDPCPERSLLARLHRDGILRLMEGLTPLQKSILRLRALEDLSYGAIAAKLDVTADAVKSAMYRIRSRLLEFEAEFGSGLAPTPA